RWAPEVCEAFVIVRGSMGAFANRQVPSTARMMVVPITGLVGAMSPGPASGFGPEQQKALKRFEVNRSDSRQSTLRRRSELRIGTGCGARTDPNRDVGGFGSNMTSPMLPIAGTGPAIGAHLSGSDACAR